MFFLLVGFSGVDAQPGPGTNPFMKKKPQKPIFERVNMHPVTGQISVFWKLPPPHKNYPPIEGILLYKVKISESGDKDLVLLKSLPLGVTYVDLPLTGDDGANGLEGSQTFALSSYCTAKVETTVGDKVYQVGDQIPSDLTPRQSTMFLEYEYDECVGKMHMKWNPYRGWPGNNVKYEVKLGASSAFANLPTHGEPFIDETDVLVDVPGNKKLWFFIRATSQDGKVSQSNLCNVESPAHQNAAGLLFLDSVVSSPKSNHISYRILPGAFANRFELVRSDDSAAFEAKLTRKVVATVGQEELGPDGYAGAADDFDEEENLQKKKRYYYLAAVNNCDQEFAFSNKANSIVLRVSNEGDKNTLVWDTLSVRRPSPWPGLGKEEQTYYPEYYVYRSSTLDGQEPRVKEILKIGQDDTHELKHVDDLADPTHGLEGFKGVVEGKRYVNRFCYVVKAYEYVSATRDRTRISISDEKCIKLNVSVEMPNGIAPLQKSSSLGLQRNLFEPKPELVTEYEMYIYDRSGKLVYTGKQWDGKLSNGDYAREGAYIYRVKIEVPGRTAKVQTGSFMVVYPTKREGGDGRKP
ncbi:MAG: hypothetical protein CSA97_01950 [Bacteroidetes bacterium]|nr:MAG: hypothetical protein CSA97_01950 [Bacteroidota bacterium]